MFAAIAAVVVLQGPPLPPVQLSDAKEFGVYPECVRGLWKQAAGHRDIVGWAVKASNSLDVYEAWEDECKWRTRCWDLLDDVLYCGWDDNYKKASLARLRLLIGEEAWERRIMPSPTPSYRGLR